MADVDHESLTLKQRVAKLESQMAFLLRNLGIASPEMPSWKASPEIIDLVRRGKRTEAIRRFRQETGAGLKDAKTFIESLEA